MATYFAPRLLLSLVSLLLLAGWSRGEAIVVPLSERNGNDSACLSAQELLRNNHTVYPPGQFSSVPSDSAASLYL